MLIKLGLLKSGNLMNLWKMERGDPLIAHSERTNSLLKTMRRILTPKQNQNCRQDPDHSAQGEWSSAKETKTIFKRCNERQRQTFWNMGNVSVFNNASIYIHGEELPGKFTFHKKIRKISQWNRCSTYLRNWYLNNLLRSMEWRQWTGKILHGSICLWLVMKKSSISSTQRSTYSQIPYCVLKRWTNTLNQILLGKTRWRGSEVLRIQSFRHNWWWANGIRVEYFPRIHHIAALQQSPRVTVKIERKTREFLQDGSSSCRCLRTTTKNASQTLNSFRFMQKDFHQDSGHSSGLDQRKSGILKV